MRRQSPLAVTVAAKANPYLFVGAAVGLPAGACMSGPCKGERMGLTRRSFVAAAGASVASTGAPLARGALRVRKNITSLSAQSDDIVAFATALRKMRAMDPRDQRSWAYQQLIHRHGGQHASWLFLPWHRAYLRQLEAVVAELSGHTAFALPYWDWQETRTLPRLLANAPFTPMPNNRSRDAATKDYHRIAFAYAYAPMSVLLTTPVQFYGQINRKGTSERTSHDIVHDAIGGDMGNVADAPWDPAFWFHHANVDRVFATRWRYNGDSDRGFAIGGRNWAGEAITNWGPNWHGLPSMYRVSDVISEERLGYRYDGLYSYPVFTMPPAVASVPRALDVPTSASRATLELVAQGADILRVGDSCYVPFGPATVQALQTQRSDVSVEGTLFVEPESADGHRIGVFATAGTPEQAVSNAMRLQLMAGLSGFGFAHTSRHDHGGGDGTYPMAFGPAGGAYSALAARFPGETLGLLIQSRALEGATKPLSVRRVELAFTSTHL